MIKTIALIPARGGSKSIPLKNIRLLNGKPLVYWSIKAACDCELVDAVHLYTDSDIIRGEIPKYIRHPKLWITKRPVYTATDDAQIESAMLEFAMSYDFETIVMMQPTSPLVTARDLTGGIRMYFGEECDSVLSVCRQRRFIWEKNPTWTSESGALPVNYEYQKRPRRQENEGFFVENGAFFITSRDALIKSCYRVSGNILLYEMPEDTYYEVDEPTDWIVVEQLLKNRLEVEQNV